MDRLIKESEKNSFYTDEIVKLCEGKVKILRYQDLKNAKNIDEVLKPWGSTIILVETKHNYGHWIALLKYKDKHSGKNIVEHFDSYGIIPDDELEFVPNEMKGELGADRRYLTSLLAKCPYKVIYNNVQLQKFDKGVSTCGRWCGLRVKFKDVPLDKFVSCFKNAKKLNPDEWVTALTTFIDQKGRDRGLSEGSGGSGYDDGPRDRLACSCIR